MNKEDILSDLSDVYPVSRETFKRLDTLVAGLIEWQRKTNLVSPTTLDHIWSRHIADSLQCLAVKPSVQNWLDLGSGGGFPGLVIAAVMGEHSKSNVELVESNQKKCAFLRRTARQMEVKPIVHCLRIEEASQHINKFPEVVSARALASLPVLLNYASPWLLKGAVAIFHKGREYKSELQDCNGLWEFDLVEHVSKVSHDSVLLEISSLKQVSKKVHN